MCMHGAMQGIARVNRVSNAKPGGPPLGDSANSKGAGEIKLDQEKGTQRVAEQAELCAVWAE